MDIPVKSLRIINGSRVVSVIDPATGERRTHGMGAVGDPLSHYLGDRGYGYSLVVLAGADAPAVYEVDTKAEPGKSGRYPTRRVPWSALGAVDVDPFAKAE